MKRRYVQIDGVLYESDAAPAPSREARSYVVGDRHYLGLRAPDRNRTPIDSRVKHREYMKRHDLSTMDDWKETWQKAAQERSKRLEGYDPSRKADVVQTLRKRGNL